MKNFRSWLRKGCQTLREDISVVVAYGLKDYSVIINTFSRSHAPAWECVPASILTTVCIPTVDAENEQTIHHRFNRLPAVDGGKRCAIPPYINERW